MMKKIKIFDKLKLEKEQEKWLVIGVVTLMLLVLFYVMPVAIGLMLITDLIASPVLRIILMGIFAVISFLTIHYTFKYGCRACMRLAIRDYEIRQKKKEKV